MDSDNAGSTDLTIRRCTVCKHPCAGHVGPYGPSCTMLATGGKGLLPDNHGSPDEDSDANLLSSGREGDDDQNDYDQSEQDAQASILLKKAMLSFTNNPANALSTMESGNAGAAGLVQHTQALPAPPAGPDLSNMSLPPPPVRG